MWFDFILQQPGFSVVVGYGLTSCRGRPECRSSPLGGAGSGTAASSLPAEPVAAFCGLKHMLYKLGGGEGGQMAG